MITRRQFSIVCSGTALAGFHSARMQASGKIVLGQSAVFTGPAAQLGIQFNPRRLQFFEIVDVDGRRSGSDIR